MSQSGNRPAKQARERVEKPMKGPLQCWGYVEPHILRDYPHRKHDSKIFYHVQETTIVNDVARSVPKIYVAVENWKEYHQDSVVELKSFISKKPISILINPRSNLIYVSPQVIKACSL